MFKVGDRVKFDVNSFGNGVGVIVNVRTGVKEYLVRSSDIILGHGIEGNEWWCSEDSLSIKNDSMTYKEFEEEVEKLGYGYSEKQCHYLVYDERGVIAWVSKEAINSVGTAFGIEASNNLLDLTVKLAKTPLEKRTEPKEMTIEEIEQELGYKVNVVGDY